jgi:hypothetical protein
MEWTVGADPEHVGGGAAANPHRSRDWKNYIKKKQGIMAGYLTGRAQDWLKTQVDGNAIYFHNFPQVELDFIAQFNTDVNKGAAEIRLQQLKRPDGQTIQEWNEVVANLVDQAFSHEPAAAQAEKIRNYFKLGLSPFLLQRYMEKYLANRMRPHDELVAICHRLDTAEQYGTGQLGKNRYQTVNVYSNRFENETETEIINANEEEDMESPRRPQRTLAFCSHCKKNGHSVLQCHARDYDLNTQKIWAAKLDRQNKTKPTFNKVFNPTNSGQQPFVRPQGGSSGNEVQNTGPPRRIMPHREAKKFAIPDGGYARNNYYEGQRTAFNMNYSRGQGAPGTMNYPFRNPAPWEMPKRDWNYQGIQNYYAQQQRTKATT